MANAISSPNLLRFAALMGAFKCKHIEAEIEAMPNEYKYLRALCCLRNYIILNNGNRVAEPGNPWGLEAEDSGKAKYRFGIKRFNQMGNSRYADFVARIRNSAEDLCKCNEWSPECVEVSMMLQDVCQGPGIDDLRTDFNGQDDLNQWCKKWFYSRILEVLNKGIDQEAAKISHGMTAKFKLYAYLGTANVDLARLVEMKSIWAFKDGVEQVGEMIPEPDKKLLPYGVFIPHLHSKTCLYGLMFSCMNVFWKMVCVADAITKKSSIDSLAIPEIYSRFAGMPVKIFVDADNVSFDIVNDLIEKVTVIDKVEKVTVYMDVDTLPLWRYSEKLVSGVGGKVEVQEIRRIVRDKSLVDAKIMADIAQAGDNCARIIVSSDSDYATIINDDKIMVLYTVDRLSVNDRYLSGLDKKGVVALPLWISDEVRSGEEHCVKVLAYERLYQQDMTQGLSGLEKIRKITELRDKVRFFARDRILFGLADLYRGRLDKIDGCVKILSGK